MKLTEMVDAFVEQELIEFFIKAVGIAKAGISGRAPAKAGIADISHAAAVRIIHKALGNTIPLDGGGNAADGI